MCVIYATDPHKNGSTIYQHSNSFSYNYAYKSESFLNYMIVFMGNEVCCILTSTLKSVVIAKDLNIDATQPGNLILNRNQQYLRTNNHNTTFKSLIFHLEHDTINHWIRILSMKSTFPKLVC